MPKGEVVSDYRPRLAAVIAAGAPTLVGFIEHYQAVGVRDIVIALHALDESCRLLAESKRVLAQFGIAPTRIVIGSWHEAQNTKLLASMTSQAQSDWWIVADGDELQVYPTGVEQVCRVADEIGADYVEGCFLDRIGEAGRLPPMLLGQSLWKTFPFASFLSWPLSKAFPKKVVLKRGWVPLKHGQHSASAGIRLHHSQCFVQVHHFKWHEQLPAYLRKRIAAFSSGEWQEVTPAMRSEAAKILEHLDNHGGAFNTGDPRFLVARCGDNYSDYPFWAEVTRLVKDEGLFGNA